jgi:hypothetical protein
MRCDCGYDLTAIPLQPPDRDVVSAKPKRVQEHALAHSLVMILRGLSGLATILTLIAVGLSFDLAQKTGGVGWLAWLTALFQGVGIAAVFLALAELLRLTLVMEQRTRPGEPTFAQGKSAPRNDV